jgi:GMP synthase (glutamine-hydrolysing)
MRFLLLQARNPGDEALEHEQVAFREILEIDPEALRSWDLLQGPPSFDLVAEHDCVLVGGAGEYGMGDAGKHPWLAAFIDFCAELAARGVPTFASCFGFQTIVVAAGGRVEPDIANAELGTFELTLTDAGCRDPLFGQLAPGFYAQFGHKDHAVEVPSGLLNLARTERCAFQALRVPDKPIYATQFHPELSMERNRERFFCYQARYVRPDLPETPEQVLASFRETPEATSLLRRYVEAVISD